MTVNRPGARSGLVSFTAREAADEPGCAALNHEEAFQGQGEGPGAKRPWPCAAASFEKPGKGATLDPSTYLLRWLRRLRLQA